MRSILLVAALLLCATIPSASAQLHPSRCQVSQEYCASLNKCLPQWAYCPSPPSVAPAAEVSCPLHTHYCNKTDECLPEWSLSCVAPEVAAASSIVREPPTPVCPHLRFWCPQSHACLPPWACCTCSQEEVSHRACRFDQYWCPASQSCISFWIGCGPDGQQVRSEADAKEPCPAEKRFCAKGNRCLPEQTACVARSTIGSAPAADTGCRFGTCNGACIPPWACCTCRESLVAQCASGTFFCTAKNQCLGFEGECK